MSDSDWRDPIRRRRGRPRARGPSRRARRPPPRARAQARESLGERVREELAGRAPPGDRRAEPPASRRRRRRRHAGRRERAGPPPPDDRADRALGAADRLRRRRRAAILSRSGDDGATARGAEARKTISLTIPEGYDRSQIAEVAKKAGLKGDYEKATKSLDAKLDLKKSAPEDARASRGSCSRPPTSCSRARRWTTLVDKQLEAFEQNIAERRPDAAAESKDLSVYDVVNIASMIEREIRCRRSASSRPR